MTQQSTQDVYKTCYKKHIEPERTQNNNTLF